MPEPNRILIVDGDPMARRFLGALMAHGGFEPHEAGDGEAAIRQAGALRPRLVILELVLPYKDGFEVIHALREDPETRALPILVVSVKDREEEIVKALDLGADDYLIKPFSTRELLARARKILGRGR
ncbi:MAG: response regulator transcription factor [Candidatus Polarisedimenticolia bacterium]